MVGGPVHGQRAANSTTAATTSRAGTNHRLVRSASRRQCDPSPTTKGHATCRNLVTGTVVSLDAGSMTRPVAHLANLDLDLLVALRELLRERSVTRAAERLGVVGSRCRPSTPRGSGSSTGWSPRPRTASRCRTPARPSCSGTARCAWWTRATRRSTQAGYAWRTWPGCPGSRRTTAARPTRRRRPSCISSSCSTSARGSRCGSRATWPCRTSWPIAEALWWHRQYEDDTAHAWLRRLIVETGRRL